MADKRGDIDSYILNNRGKYSDHQIRSALKHVGWKKTDIKAAFKRLSSVPMHEPEISALHKTIKMVFALFALVALVGLAYAYLFIINPAFIAKPFIAKPPLGLATDAYSFSPESARFVLNEIGAYKLRPVPVTGELPTLGILVTDTQQVLSATVVKNDIQMVDGQAPNPDIMIKSDASTFNAIVSADESIKAISKAFENGKVSIEFLAPADKLVLKGYKALYDIHSKGGTLTGNVVLYANSDKGLSIALVLALMFLFLIAAPVIKRLQ